MILIVSYNSHDLGDLQKVKPKSEQVVQAKEERMVFLNDTMHLAAFW